MKKIINVCLLSILLASVCFTKPVSYKVNKIEHPKLDFKNPRPLIIDYQLNENRKYKIVITPMLYNFMYITDGKEYEDPKFSKFIYYDAYERPDKKGFVLYKITSGYDSKGFEEISVWDLSRDESTYLDPFGEDIYFSKDCKDIIVVAYKMVSDIDIGAYILQYYDLENIFNSKRNKPYKKIEVKEDEFRKLALIPLRKGN